MAHCVGVRRVQHVSGIAVDDDGGSRRRIAFGVSAMAKRYNVMHYHGTLHVADVSMVARVG